MKHHLYLAVSLCLLLGCGGEPTPTPDLVATQIAVEKAAHATMTAEVSTATITNAPADTPKPETLVSPKGDGFYTVGVEIAPGKWESTGTGTDCYWERLDEFQETLDIHVGLAGSTVTILDTDYEVHFEGCGTWEYVDGLNHALQPEATEPAPTPTPPTWLTMDGRDEAAGITVMEINVWKDYENRAAGVVVVVRHGERVKLVRRSGDAVLIETSGGQRGWVTYYFIEEYK